MSNKSQIKNNTDKDCENNPWDFSGYKVLFLNCTLNRSGVLSHTETLFKNTCLQIFEKNKVNVEILRPVDYEIPAGLELDYTDKYGYKKDDWPMIQKKIDDCDILILGTSIWLGEKSSVANRVLERMYGYTHLLNKKGQYRDYGKVGATLITGNEDGIKHCAMNILFSLSHIGYSIPPQADAGWLGEVGPGPSYADENSGGIENDFTNRNSSFLAWNVLHLARILKQEGGFPAYGNLPKQWKIGCKPSFKNPEYKS